MPEISDNAAIFIATSYQAFKRAEMGDKSTTISNCVVALVFAGFYLEETLDVIISKLEMEDKLRTFFEYKKGKPIGMLYKLAWFYNSFIANTTLSKVDLLKKTKTGKYLILRKLNKKFPGFRRLYQFRNDVAHGKINRFANFKDTDTLRQQTKDIVSELLRIANNIMGKEIPRTITYMEAVSNFSRNYPTVD